MRRHLISRIFLSFLLLWQLGAGAFAHTHGSSTARPATDVATVSITEPAEHCPGHAAMMADAQTALPAEPAQVVVDVEPVAQHDAHSDCCSAQCDCPCAHALVWALSFPYVPAALPNVRSAHAATASRIDAGICGLFRPPI